jgi:hypothetical protein
MQHNWTNADLDYIKTFGAYMNTSKVFEWRMCSNCGLVRVKRVYDSDAEYIYYYNRKRIGYLTDLPGFEGLSCNEIILKSVLE